MNTRIVLFPGRQVGLVVASAALLFAAGCQTTDEAESPMALSDMPAPVREAILARTPEANITSLTHETDEGQAVYEVNYTAEGRAHEAEFDATGRLLDEEVDDIEDED